MITDPDEFFARGCGRCARFDTPDCSTRRWADGLATLRTFCRDAGLEETSKWGHPCYMHAGRNIAIIGAFRDDFRLTFFDAALLNDTEGLLEKQGPNTGHPGTIRFDSGARVAKLAPVVRAYLDQAKGYAEKGIKAPRNQSEPALPEELIEALDADIELAEAFEALTPGRRRSYAINLASAKQSKTRIARIARFRDGILAGKGATER